MLAVSDGAPVGVDIEKQRAVDYLRLAERFFHPGETAYLLQAGDPCEAFFTLWTLKESYLKATGDGFSAPLSYACILPDACMGATVTGAPGWLFRRYGAPPGYSLAVCSTDGGFPAAVETLDLLSL